jgi:hypothetical protein
MKSRPDGEDGEEIRMKRFYPELRQPLSTLRRWFYISQRGALFVSAVVKASATGGINWSLCDRRLLCLLKRNKPTVNNSNIHVGDDVCFRSEGQCIRKTKDTRRTAACALVSPWTAKIVIEIISNRLDHWRLQKHHHSLQETVAALIHS